MNYACFFSYFIPRFSHDKTHHTHYVLGSQDEPGRARSPVNAAGRGQRSKRKSLSHCCGCSSHNSPVDDPTMTTTAHVLASNSTSIDKKRIEEEAVRVRDAATRSQRWETLATFDLFRGAQRPLPLPLPTMILAHSFSYLTIDPLYDPPPTPDMSLIEPFQSTDFPTLLGQNIEDADTGPRKQTRLDKATIHHVIPDVRVFLISP